MASNNKVCVNIDQTDPENGGFTDAEKQQGRNNIGAIPFLDGGTLTDGASINVPNNSISRLTTSQSALTLNVNLVAGEVANFAVEITASANITLTITSTLGNAVTTLKYAAAAGNALESGKFYQVTCVGSCWTLAEFTAPSAST